MDREVFCRRGSALGPVIKLKIARFVTNKGSRLGKLHNRTLDEACLKRRYSVGSVLKLL